MSPHQPCVDQWRLPSRDGSRILVHGLLCGSFLVWKSILCCKNVEKKIYWKKNGDTPNGGENMDEALLKVIRYDRSPEESIDQTRLEQFTRRFTFDQVDQIDWSRVRHLHSITDGEYDGYPRLQCVGIEEGIYVSHDGTWVLVTDHGGIVSKVIPDCPDLELLHICYGVPSSLDVSSLTKLKTLRLTENRIILNVNVTGIEKLAQLERLYLKGIDGKDTFDLYNLIQLVELNISYFLPKKNHYVFGVNHLRKLKKLHLRELTLLEPLDISRFPHLTDLSIIHIAPSEYIQNISCAQRLGRMAIGRKPPCKPLDVSGLTALEELHIDGYCSDTLVLGHLPRLKKLTLVRDYEGGGLDISGLTGVEELSFIANSKTREIKGFSKLSELRKLTFYHDDIRIIPDEIRTLRKIQRFDIEGLKLDEFPEWLLELELPFSTDYYSNGIIIKNVHAKDVDMSIFDQPQEVIRQWFEERKRGNTVPLNEVKVVFLGDGEAGKTHTIARLLRDGKKPTAKIFDGKATPGIVIQNKGYELDGKKIQVHFWDFGGQEILHSMHRMFLTERTLYVVIINARDDTQDDRARYWLHNIKSFAGTAPVLLVLNKIDQNPNASINTPNLQKMYDGLKEVVRMSALEDSLEQFNSTFTEALLRQVRELGTLGTLWPKSWLALKNGLEKMEGNYIHGMDYEDLCESCGVEKNREELLHWFNDLGVSFCYEGSDKLEDYVILKPEWLTNAIYIILFNKCPDTENGIIPLKAINRMLRAPRKGQTDEIRRVLKDVFYDPTETDYVMDVIRKFRLSYEVRKDAEFIPVLCQRESMAVAEEYEDDPDALEFRLDYEYLPDNVIHRLMVEMRQDLDTRNVWRTGARFVQQGTGLSAVVKSDGNMLRIFVRSESANHRPNTYLHIIKGNIDRIVADLKLQPPYCEVIYKADGITEAFDYEDLIAAQQDGWDTYRSKKLRRSIPIQDILNQSGRTAEVELDKLRAAIITVCMQFQGNSKFWDATEDELNTYVRDALRIKGYLVYDQTFQGIGGGEKRAGELDLDIRQKPDVPWTIYEALKIRDKSKTQWNAHLAKLLDNYNPSGLNYLFLVTYVDCGKDVFQDIWENFSEHIRWHNAGVYERLPNSFSHIDLASHNNPHYIRAVRCTYDRTGSPTTVCHIFVRMGR